MPTALIAEDETLLAHALLHELQALWPQLQVLALAGDGLSAVQLALQHRPDVCFFDIRMPGQSGLEAAAELAEAWPGNRPLPLIVFVSAHDEYALQAFEAQALDYVLKPVRAERLARTVLRLQERLPQAQGHVQNEDALLASLRALLSASTGHMQQPRSAALPPLTLLQASSAQGQLLRMVPIEEVLLLEATDKYVRALTHDGEQLWLRTPLKELLARLDAETFWQIHRSCAVRASAIHSARRDEQGAWRVRIKGLETEHKVSRLFAHRFKGM
jgi:DNA-binding LytR/AlgR family response regulator